MGSQRVGQIEQLHFNHWTVREFPLLLFFCGFWPSQKPPDPWGPQPPIKLHLHPSNLSCFFQTCQMPGLPLPCPLFSLPEAPLPFATRQHLSCGCEQPWVPCFQVPSSKSRFPESKGTGPCPFLNARLVLNCHPSISQDTGLPEV